MQKWYASIIITICVIALLIDRYDWLPPLLRQFLLIPNRNNTFMDLIANCSTPCLNSAGILTVSGALWVFSFSIAKSNSKALGSGTSGSAVCIYVCLTSITPCTFNSWEKQLLHVAKILWESATKSLFSSFTILVLGWYPFLKSLMPLHKSLTFLNLLLVSSSSILAFRYVPEMSASFMSYIVQIIYIALAWSFYPLHFSLLPFI